MKKLSILTVSLLCVGLLGACSNQKMNSEVSKNDKSNMQTKADSRSEEHTSELQSPRNLVCRLLLEKKK